MQSLYLGMTVQEKDSFQCILQGQLIIYMLNFIERNLLLVFLC